MSDADDMEQRERRWMAEAIIAKLETDVSQIFVPGVDAWMRDGADESTRAGLLQALRALRGALSGFDEGILSPSAREAYWRNRAAVDELIKRVQLQGGDR